MCHSYLDLLHGEIAIVRCLGIYHRYRFHTASVNAAILQLSEVSRHSFINHLENVLVVNYGSHYYQV